MASTNHTANYNLPQWVSSDPFRREDFNDAFSAIDTAIKTVSDAAADAGNCSICFGSWVGDGMNSRTVTLPRTPKLLIILGEYNGSYRVIFVTAEVSVYISPNGISNATSGIHFSGAELSFTNRMYCNESDKTTHYVLFY